MGSWSVCDQVRGHQLCRLYKVQKECRPLSCLMHYMYFNKVRDLCDTKYFYIYEKKKKKTRKRKKIEYFS